MSLLSFLEYTLKDSPPSIPPNLKELNSNELDAWSNS